MPKKALLPRRPRLAPISGPRCEFEKHRKLYSSIKHQCQAFNYRSIVLGPEQTLDGYLMGFLKKTPDGEKLIQKKESFGSSSLLIALSPGSLSAEIYNDIQSGLVCQMNILLIQPEEEARKDRSMERELTRQYEIAHSESRITVVNWLTLDQIYMVQPVIFALSGTIRQNFAAQRLKV